MAERELVTPDSISTLIYVDMRGETGGYRTDLLKEQVSKNMRKFIFCSKCDGISINPQISGGKTFCTNCTEGRGGEVDRRADGVVRELECRCPLSIRGCDWSGKLDDIEEHMNGCVKVRIKCEKVCGEVLQKCDTKDHQKKCPFRNQMCEYCRKEIQANRTNEHARICLDNPDGVVTCPYMEVGCETIEIARKDLNTHITQNMISHQKLLLHELNQLRIENKQLSDKMNIKEFETTNKQTNLHRSDTNTNRSIWILLALVITGIAILIPLILMERDRIHQNELSIQSTIQSIQTHEQSIQSTIQSIQTHEQSIQSTIQSIQTHGQSIQTHEQSIQTHEQSIQSTIQSIQSHEQSIQSTIQSIQSTIQSIQSNQQSIQSNQQSIHSNEQSIRSLMSTAGYITEFISDRSKTLQGIEWTHGYREDEIIYGPILYLGPCELRIYVVTVQYSWDTSPYNADYYVRRLKGDNNDFINSCTITYIHLYNVNLADNSKFNIESIKKDIQLEVGEEYWINCSDSLWNTFDKLTTVRIFFEFA